MARQTPLYAVHQELGARIIDFNGWDMPVQYPAGILAEHAAVRERAGVFDTCHMGEFTLRGADVRAALNSMLSGDFRKLKAGRMRYTFITAGDGTVVDDAVVFLVGDDEAMICVNAGDIAGDYDFLRACLPDGYALEDNSSATGKLDVQGPAAHGIISTVCGVDLRTLPFYSFITTTWRDKPLLLSRSGYTGSPGVELFIESAAVEGLWREILAAGAGQGLLPCGLGARDTLRLEAGLPLYGHELSRELNPLQAGFGRFVALEKAEDFPGKGALRASREARVLAGLRILDKRVARQGFALLADGREVGCVTSGGPAPTVGGNIALCYIDTALAEPGRRVAVDIRGKAAEAEVCTLPFYKCDELRTIAGKQG